VLVVGQLEDTACAPILPFFSSLTDRRFIIDSSADHWFKLTVKCCRWPLAIRSSTMGKEQKSSREGKKKAAMTPKEKKAAKRTRKENKPANVLVSN